MRPPPYALVAGGQRHDEAPPPRPRCRARSRTATHHHHQVEIHPVGPPSAQGERGSAAGGGHCAKPAPRGLCPAALVGGGGGGFWLGRRWDAPDASGGDGSEGDRFEPPNIYHSTTIFSWQRRSMELLSLMQ
jgi:hypothetical protein